MPSWMARMFNWEASRPKYKAHEIVERLQLREGGIVADIGSGGGYFTFIFSGKVGNSGTVYAVDTRRTNLDYIQARAAEKGLRNVKTILADEDRLNLPEDGIDVVFLRNVFHHLKDPASYFRGIGRFLKRDGKIVIIDHGEKTKGLFVGHFKHYTSEEDIVKAMAGSGFKLFERSDFLPAQSFLVFELTSRLLMKGRVSVGTVSGFQLSEFPCSTISTR
jgi:arsenite methyltransferase